MSATTTSLERGEAITRAHEALEVLVELRDHIPDLDGSWRSSAVAKVIRHWNAGPDAPIWMAIQALLPPVGGADPESSKLREAAENLLVALWDAEYERREESNHITLHTLRRLRRANAQIGATLDAIEEQA